MRINFQELLEKLIFNYRLNYFLTRASPNIEQRRRRFRRHRRLRHRSSRRCRRRCCCRRRQKMSFFVNFAELTTFFKRLLSVSAGLRTKRFAISVIRTDLGWCVWRRASYFYFSLKNAAA